MNNGVSIDGILLHKCQTGEFRDAKLSAAEREAACHEYNREYKETTGITAAPLSNTDTRDAILLTGLLVLPLILGIILGHVVYKRKLTHKSIKNKKARKNHS